MVALVAAPEPVARRPAADPLRGVAVVPGWGSLPIPVPGVMPGRPIVADITVEVASAGYLAWATLPLPILAAGLVETLVRQLRRAHRRRRAGGSRRSVPRLCSP